ncbi:hypothetical protein BDY19DRAFT_994068 [Irpex rosettiformis]|uniref:Uncharacterized protein n=1 Tax=Irpex rosettiformis TaxID=378272 RepID=A0ACB8U3P0_9APHY|nr:hypothetical protein BDY19DRAFT_994068 [Irpex rosettiformis]
MSTFNWPSSSSSTSSVSFTSSQMSSASQYTSKPSSIAALPSFAHSLSALPRMTSVTSDMVHYGTLARTKQASEAKLQTALQSAKQRPSGTYPSLPSPSHDCGDDDDDALVIHRRKAKTCTARIV